MNQSGQLQKLSRQAKAEIGEASVDINAQLDTLKRILEDKYANLELPQDFDDFLVRCLRVRKFDISRAAKLVSQYFKLMLELSDMQCFLVPSVYNDLYTDLGISLLKYRDSEGRAVLLARQEKVPPDIYNFDQSLGAAILMLDEVNRISVDTQRLGVVLIVDWKGYSFAHFKQLSPSRLRTAAKLFQDAFPVRFKAFHFVRNPWLISCMFAIVKPFLRQKIKERVHFHGHNFKSFYEHVSPDILPQFLGGKLANNNYADMNLTSTLLGQDDYYKDVLAHGYK